MADSDREVFRNLLVDYFAILTASGLGEVKLLSKSAAAKYKEIAGPKADDVLRSYERNLYVSAISDAVITRVGEALRSRTRIGRLIEVGLNISLLVMAALIGLSQFIFDPEKNKTQISAVYFALLVIVALQLFGNLYLRYFDHHG